MARLAHADRSASPLLRIRSNFSEGITRSPQTSTPSGDEVGRTLTKLLYSFLLLCTVLALFPARAFAASIQDACSLIASTDAQTALGEAVGPPRAEDRSSGSGEGSSCRYRSTVGSALKGKSVSLMIHYSSTDLTGSSNGIADSLKSEVFKNVQSVTGIGTAAVWATNSVLGRAQGELTVIQGKSVMLVILIDGIPDEADALARSKAIAARAIGKLK